MESGFDCNLACDMPWRSTSLPATTCPAQRPQDGPDSTELGTIARLVQAMLPMYGHRI